MTRAKKTDFQEELQTRLGICFSDQRLFTQALTHRSVLAETVGLSANERLEFLGDAVLDLVIAEHLYRHHPEWTEGQLTKAKASLVEERSLERVARLWNLGPYLILSHGEDLSGGRQRGALLADTVEAVIGAYYLDQGLEACRTFILVQVAYILDAGVPSQLEHDYKTQLQEAFQARYHATPSYAVVEEHGPPHSRLFTVEVAFMGEVIGAGSGRSKKNAEQQAAEIALHSAFLAEERDGEASDLSPCE